MSKIAERRIIIRRRIVLAIAEAESRKKHDIPINRSALIGWTVDYGGSDNITRKEVEELLPEFDEWMNDIVESTNE